MLAMCTTFRKFEPTFELSCICIIYTVGDIQYYIRIGLMQIIRFNLKFLKFYEISLR